MLMVDNEEPIRRASNSGSTQLDTDGWLYVGGGTMVPWGLPNDYYESFSGCIESITINRQELRLVDDREGHTSTITFCS